MFEELWRDDRAIEGLPIRLVIALVVGVASLSVMMGMLDDLNGLGVSEVDARPAPEVIGAGNTTSVTVVVVDGDGKPVADATVIAKSGTARLKRVATNTTGPDGEAQLRVTPTLGPNQGEGTVELAVKPPAGDYVDRRENTPILVMP